MSRSGKIGSLRDVFRSRCARVAFAGVATGAVLAGGFAVAPSAGAVEQPRVGAQAPSKGFHVYNLSSDTVMEWSSQTKDGTDRDWSGRPVAYSTMKPGDGFQDWELNYHGGFDNYGDVTYKLLGEGNKDAGWFDVHLANNGVNLPFASCKVRGFDGQCSVSGSDIFLMDKPGTVHDIPAGGPGQWQGRTIQQMCDHEGADCYFNPTKETFVDSDPHPVGNALVNTGPKDSSTTVTQADVRTDSNTVGISMSIEYGFSKLVKGTIETSYSHTWTHERSFSQATTIYAAPGEKAWVEGVTPMIRDTGDITLKIGNTVWNFHDVNFDTPDPDTSKAGSFIARCVLIGTNVPCPVHERPEAPVIPASGKA